jgi:SAM-dependent methyltransferase
MMGSQHDARHSTLRESSAMDIQGIGKILGPKFDAVAADCAIALRELGLPADAALLDVGTGNGNFAIYLASQGFHVLTGEPSSDRSRYAGKNWASNAERAGVRDRIRFQAFDASRLPFDSETFDAVFFFGVLHHIDKEIRSDVFREALRVTRRNGSVVFFEPRKKMLDRLWVDDPGHPLAANPADYLAGQSIPEQRVEGSLMDIFIYRNAAPEILVREG